MEKGRPEKALTPRRKIKSAKAQEKKRIATLPVAP